MGSPAAQRSASPRALARVRTTAGVIANGWRFAVAIFAIAIVLGMLGIDLAPLLASATIIGATLGFGAQMAIRDYLSGFLLTVEDQFGIGDTISVNGVTGTVEELGLRVTRIRVADGSLVFVPNGDIRLLANSSRGWAKAVVEVTVPVASADDLTKTTEVITQAATEVAHEASAAAGCTQAPEVLGLVSNEGGQGTLRVMLRTNHTHRTAVERTLRGAIVSALAAAGTWSATPAPEEEPSGAD
jgi:small conductance mechanosensitive channel